MFWKNMYRGTPVPLSNILIVKLTLNSKNELSLPDC